MHKYRGWREVGCQIATSSTLKHPHNMMLCLHHRMGMKYNAMLPEPKGLRDVSYRSNYSGLFKTNLLLFLPEKAAANVLRQLSSLPSSSNWKAYLPISEFMTMVDLGGPLCAAAFRELRSLTSTLYPHTLSVLAPNPEELTTFYKLFHVADEYILTLQICRKSHFTGGLEWKEKCSNLRALSLLVPHPGFPLEEVISVVGNQLEVLELSASNSFALPAQRVDNLSPYLTRLRIFSFNSGREFASFEHPMKSLWTAIGRTVQTIAIHNYCPREWLFWIDHECITLQTLTLGCFVDFSTSRVARLAFKHKGSLRRLNLYHNWWDSAWGTGKKSTNEQEIILSACPSLLVNLTSNCTRLFQDAKLLHMHVYRLNLWVNAKQAKEVSLMSKCLPDMEKLKLVRIYFDDQDESLPLKLLQNILGCMENVEEARLHATLRQDEDTLNIIDVVSEAWKALRRFELRCFSPPPGSFDHFATKCSNLEIVTFEFQSGFTSDGTERQYDFEPEECVKSLLSSFANSRALKALKINNSPYYFDRCSISNSFFQAVASLQLKKVQVIINEVEIRL